MLVIVSRQFCVIVLLWGVIGLISFFNNPPDTDAAAIYELGLWGMMYQVVTPFMFVAFGLVGFVTSKSDLPGWRSYGAYFSPAGKKRLKESVALWIKRNS